MAKPTVTKILSLDDILNAPDLPESVISVPEWGGSVKIRAFTKAQTQRMRDRATLKHNSPTQKAGDIDANLLEMQMLVEGVIEPKLTSDVIPALREKAAGPIERVLKAILELSGMTDTAVADAEAAFQGE